MKTEEFLSSKNPIIISQSTAPIMPELAELERVFRLKTLVEDTYSTIAMQIKNEVELIQKNIKLPFGFNNWETKKIKIMYEHILGMELQWNKKTNKLSINGFHHDLNNTFEKKKIIIFTDKIFNDHGCYKTKLLINGISTPKSFFPAHWTREKVIQKIKEAYENFRKTGIIPDLNDQKKYIIKGFSYEGIEIEMCFNASGEMRTAYPVFKKEII